MKLASYIRARRCSSLLKDRSGASAVEFAVIAPVLIMFLLGIVQYGVLSFKMVDMRFHANHLARALAAQAIKLDEAVNMCKEKLSPQGYSCTSAEDANSYTVGIAYDTNWFGLSFVPQPATVKYDAVQVKYAVQ